MENILKELSEIDKKAKQIVASAEKDLFNLGSAMQSGAAQIYNEIDADISKKIAQAKVDCADYISIKKAEIDAVVNARLAKMEEEWLLNADKWTDEVFLACVNQLYNTFLKEKAHAEGREE